MVDYLHKSLKPDGAELKGKVTATSEQDAYQQLRDRGLEPYELHPARAGALDGLARLTQRVNAKARARYIRQMATLLSAGLPLLDVMDSMARGGHPVLKQKSAAIRRDLKAGQKLSSAMARHLPDFPGYIVHLAELGEGTGALPTALSDAAQRMEQEEAMASEIRSALTYPSFLAVAGLGVTIFMFLVIVPRFETMIGNNWDSLPAISVAVMTLSKVFRDNMLILALLALGLLVFGLSLVRSAKARQSFRNFLDGLPMIGPFLRRAELANWSRTMGVALKNGATLLGAFDLAGRSARGSAFTQGLKEARRSIRAGRPVDEALSQAIDLDPTFTDLLRTGRQASALDKMLLFIADILDDEARERAQRLTTLAEPVAILLISAVVGTLVVAIVLAMTSLYSFDI